MRVGVPQGLYFWLHAPLWVTFLRDLGVEPVISRATTRATLDAGIRLAVEEACLPVKVFFGHCAELAVGTEALFVPRVVSVEPRAYICPKFMGLPDMVRHSLGRQVAVLSPVVDLRKGGTGWPGAAREVARALGIGRHRAEEALAHGLQVQRRAEQRCEGGEHLPAVLAELGLLPPDAERARDSLAADRSTGTADSRRLGVLGHSYNIYDRQVSLDLIRRLEKAGWSVQTVETVPAARCEEEARQLSKELFWTLGRRQYGAAAHLSGPGGVAGLIYLGSFGCGPDSLVGELVAQLMERRGVPFLRLTMDEHTGEAGAWTRVEAFLDMIERREGKRRRPS
ncbi:MAG: acyl-CoA dehydratase activase-related protein [Betaproteobacteria bacterium]